MILTYSGRSAPSARKIAEASDNIQPLRQSRGDINWGKRVADTELNADISNTTNKRVMRQLFKEHGVPMPKLYDSTGVVNVTFPLVGRPDYHTRGRGFWKCYSQLDMAKALAGTRKKKAATHFMEYIDAPREYRVHIFLGKSIRISEKIFEGRQYTTGRPNHPVKHIRKAAKKAVEALGVDFGAVDILANDSECWVLEVNAAPGLGGSMPELYARVFEEWENGEW